MAEVTGGLFALVGGVWRALGEAIGATGVVDGLPGVVPQPMAGDDTLFLKGDMTFGAPMTGSGAPPYFQALAMLNTDSADWAVNGIAELDADSINAAIKVRQFLDAVELGAGLPILVPSSATTVQLTSWTRPLVAPGGATTANQTLYGRATGAAVSGWSTGVAMTSVSLPTNTDWQTTTSAAIALASVNLTAGLPGQLEFTRDGSADAFTGTLLLQAIQVEFAA